MSLKENINFVKNELSTEEKFFESVVKLEDFYKKYKIMIIGVVVALVFGFIGYKINNYFKTQSLIATNEAYNKLLSNSGDKEALELLKRKNEPLYDIYQLKQAMEKNDLQTLQLLQNSQNEFVADVAKYQLASSNSDLAKLTSYDLSTNALMKDLGLLQEAYILIQEGKYQDAKLKLDSISKESAVERYSSMMAHFLITKVAQ